MTTMVFDLETNGLLDDLDKVHCMSVKVLEGFDGGSVYRYRNNTKQHMMIQGLEFLATADIIVGHNIIKFDVPVIKKLYPDWKFKGEMFDTLVASRLIWTDLKDRDLKLILKGKLPRRVYGRHSLEAWGYRLGNYKGDFKGPWDTWTQEMDDYCEQDVCVTTDLYSLIRSKNYSEEALNLEHATVQIINRQELNGFSFNVVAASGLYSQLVKEQTKLEQEIVNAFPIHVKRGKEWTPKRDNKKMCYTAGVEMCKVQFQPLNASSRPQVAQALVDLRGWKPTVFGANGKPELSEKVVKKLKFLEAPTINRLLMIDKRVGQVATGKQAWLKREKGGKIHGSVNTNGAVTGRMTHSYPNLGQVPAVGHPFGQECRALFEAKKGWKLVGCDASGLEVRCLGHYMAPYDGGEYCKIILEGDIHQYNCDILNKHVEIIRYDTKTFFYAFLYGAGNGKLGEIVKKGPPMGKKLRKIFLDGLPALDKLIKGVQRASKRGYLIGLDGRKLHVRSEHSALNTLLQGAGAIVMKKALVLADHSFLDQQWKYGEDYAQCVTVHDEAQWECKPELVDKLGKLAVQSIRDAGKHFNFRIPLDAEYKIGTNWAETH